MKMTSFRALTADTGKQPEVRVWTTDRLPAGELLVRVAYSGLNYKDGLACSPGGGSVVKTFPIIPGIDLAGTVVSSTSDRFREGDRVLATGYGLGVSHCGGYAEYASVPADWAVPLPDGLSEREAMALGTAGFTAALSVHRLELNGLRPEAGEVLVTGASGGVGSLATAILARRGYRVAAVTGKPAAADYLRGLGAARILPREELLAGERRALDKQRWAAAVDPVGGEQLAAVLASVAYGGSVAVSGLAGGGELPTTVYPFILRGVSLLGIDSVFCPHELRGELWRRLASDWKPARLEQVIAEEITLEEIPAAAARILKGELRGRTLVRIGIGE